MTPDEIRLKAKQISWDISDLRIELDLLRLKCKHPAWVGLLFKRCRDCGKWK